MVYRTFQVYCNNDAHILLSEMPNGQGQAYEIVLGGWENTKSALRKSVQGENIFEVDGAVCNPEEYVVMTVSISNGNVIRVSHGEDPISNIWFTHTDPEPLWKINFMMVMTGWGSRGLWKFQEIEEPREIHYRVEDHDQCLQERNGFNSAYTCAAHGPTYCNPAHGHQLNAE
jgi:hypothetical protein